MDELTIKHLEMIQAIITRMARCSFAYKGWAVTLVAAIFALAVKEADPRYFLIALLPTFMFWGLDGYYLRQERLFRKLYDHVRDILNKKADWDPFSMNTKPFIGDVATWWRVCWSRTVAGLYGPLVIIVVAILITAITIMDC